MEIHNRFTGGNIRVKEICGQEIVLENELRDTMGDWFYWAFCVECAQGQTLTFRFGKNRLGYWGPAVSHDLENWHWLESCSGDSFTYHFKNDEDKVYFAHNMLYHPARFEAFTKRMGLAVSELCQSLKGRSVPCLSIGDGDMSILMTARHHACESTGNYVLEGVLEEFARELPKNTRVFCVPFVDYDGVVDGDQGKSRAPHDHNRDYTDNPIYPEVKAICEYARQYGCWYAFDFHAPWHKGGENDFIYIVRNRAGRNEEYDAFAALLEKEITPDAMQYSMKNDHPANTGWNQPSANFSFTMHNRPECALAFSLENTYFGTMDNKVSGEKLVELGRCFVRAAKKYMSCAQK